MGRTDGKLVTFLRDALKESIYPNLKWEEFNSVFSLVLPRYEKSKEQHYAAFARILMDWYKCNGKDDKYTSYSNAKAVFQAALKKSVYLISLPTTGRSTGTMPVTRRIMFRFATPEEAKEKRMLLKERERAVHNSTLYARAGTPSLVSTSECSMNEAIHEDPFYAGVDGSPSSSGYGSSEEMLVPEEEPFYGNSPGSPSATSGCSDIENAGKSELSEEINNSLDGILKDLEKSRKTESIDLSEMENFFNELLENNEAKAESAIQQHEEVMPLVEVKFYWQFYKKSNFDSVLLLIFKKQFFIENENSNKAGDIIIPNEVWEEREYEWKNAVELDGKLFLFFQKK